MFKPIFPSHNLFSEFSELSIRTQLFYQPGWLYNHPFSLAPIPALTSLMLCLYDVNWEKKE